MNIVIDANNLAGSLGILKNENFAEELTKMLIVFNQGKSRHVFLVFDSIDLMGDTFEVENKVVVIYSPRDSHYQNADDMIVQIIHNNLEKTSHQNEILIVTDDIELSERIIDEHKEYGKRVFLEKARDFKFKLLKKVEEDECEEDIGKEEDWDDYNRGLLRLWK